MAMPMTLLAALAIAQPQPAETREAEMFDVIAKQIDGRRIVALGEAGHGDGTTFAFKARLIEYLVREHGYDVLAFESGLWSLDEAQALVDNGEPVSKALSGAIFPVWARADQFGALYGVLDALEQEDMAPTLAGFDFQPTGTERAAVVETLKTLAGSPADDREAISRIASRMETLASSGGRGIAELDLDLLDGDRREAIAALERSDRATRAMDVRLVDSVARMLRFYKIMSGGMDQVTSEEFNVRDQVMADNLAALATTRFANRKIILWGATSHFLKDRTAIDVESAPEMVPMGAHLASGPLATDYYVLGFSALGGQSGSMRSGPFNLPGAEPDTLEARMMSVNPDQDSAFVALPPCGTQRQKVRALGHAQWTGDWGCAVDGLVIFREMEATTYSTP